MYLPSIQEKPIVTTNQLDQVLFGTPPSSGTKREIIVWEPTDNGGEITPPLCTNEHGLDYRKLVYTAECFTDSTKATTTVMYTTYFQSR